MTVFISLLRGINVGGHHLIKMQALRELADGLGFANPSTYIQSGNLVFDHSAKKGEALSKKLAKALLDEFGFEVPVVTRTLAEWKKTINASPFRDKAESAPKEFHVTFLSGKPKKADVAKLAECCAASELMHAIGQALYLHFPNGSAKTKLTKDRIERDLGLTATTRNWRTVLKLEELAKER